MSFVVSFQGQFKPYTLPDLSHYDRVHHVYRSTTNNKISDKAEFNNLLKEEKNKSSGQRIKGISSYQKQEKVFEKEHIPHLARDIMSENLKLLKETDSFIEAQNLLKKYNINHLPIINKENRLIGMVSDRDLLKASDPTLKISDFMTPEVLTCFEITRIQDISKIMLHERISAIPIINDSHELTGIVTKTDILRFLTKIISINDIV